jgi:hypothetical protein
LLRKNEPSFAVSVVLLNTLKKSQFLDILNIRFIPALYNVPIAASNAIISTSGHFLS